MTTSTESLAARQEPTRSVKYVYFFGENRAAEGNAGMKALLGGKGAGLAEMTNAGVPVPPGFTVTTEVCRWYYAHERTLPPGFEREQREALGRLERVMGRRLGHPQDPLLVSVRSGAMFSMPGMMDTVLNLGLNDRSVEGLTLKTQNARFAWDCYRRFIQMFGSVVLGLEKHDFEEHLSQFKKRKRAKTDQDLDADDIRELVAEFKAMVKKRTGQEFAQDPLAQLALARDAVFRSWSNDRAVYYRKQNRIPDDIGTAVNVQAMVFGNLGERSATGVGFTRDPATGENRFYGEYLLNAQGEDVVAGVRTPHPIAQLERELPEAYRQLREITQRLEKHYRDVQDFEFTIEEGKLYLLQTRTGKRTAQAAVKIAVDMAGEGLITRDEAIMRVEPAALDQLLHPRLDPGAKLSPIATGLAASPGAAVGKAVFDAEAAAARGKSEKVILVRKETTPDDIHGMDAAQGILTATGGMTCIAGETRLLTDHGFLSAEALFQKLEAGGQARILSLDSVKMTPAWKPIIAAGCKQSEVMTIAISQTGRAGHNTLRLTRDHKMLVLHDRKLAKKPLNECLQDRDFVLALDRLPELEPVECSPELAYVAGAIFSDGHIRLSPSKGVVVFTQKPVPEKLAFIAAVETRFEEALGVPFTMRRVKHAESILRGRVIRGSAEDLICTRRAPAERLMKIRNGLAQWALGLEREELLAFVGGYGDGDGTISVNSAGTPRLQIVVAAANRNLLEGLTVACLRLGILPQITVNREAYQLQITERVEEILACARRVRADVPPRRYDSKCFSIRSLFDDVVEDVNYLGRVREAQKRNIMYGASKIRRDLLPLCEGGVRAEVETILDSAVRSYRVDPCHGSEPAIVYNFEVEADSELDKNFVVFTSHYTPIVVSNSHAAVVARGMGTPCVCGAGDVRVDEAARRFTAGGVTVKEGDWITLDGSTGRVFTGQAPLVEAELSGEFGVFMEWADGVRRLKVRSNADIPRDAKQAREYGAEGIGLCRTEHMFFAQDRLPWVVQLIMAAPRVKALEARLEAAKAELDGLDAAAARKLKPGITRLAGELKEPQGKYREALAKLLPLQRADFKGLFEAMDGYPVTIRTLDPPLHEFLPRREELMSEVAVMRAQWGGGKGRSKARKPPKLAKAEALLAEVEALHEFNPMLGHRGCRLGITYPGITEMQARAIFEAACDVAKRGVSVIPEIMIPLVGHVAELVDQAAVVRRVAGEVMAKTGVRVEYLVGTMIEVPRAAITAEQVASEAEFFSFGTNDLTQLTFGFSRDDAGKFLPEYVERKILPQDPFVSLDTEGVGALVEWAVERGRRGRPGLKVGICGEHGGDPASVQFCHRAGLDYVSCSPFRVPIARLAAAQAALQGKAAGSDQR